MLAGRNEPVVRIALDFVAARQSAATNASLARPAPGCEMMPRWSTAPAGHALDFDDVALGGHPSTVLVPAILAEGQRLDASGADALRAYLVGYEVWASVLSREQDPYHLKGWHPTAVLGTLPLRWRISSRLSESAVVSYHVAASTCGCVAASTP